MERRELQLRQREYQAELASLEQLLVGMGPESTMGPPHAPGDASEATAPIDVVAARLYSQVAVIDGEVAALKSNRGMTDLHPEIQKLYERRRAIAGGLSNAESGNDSAVTTNQPQRISPVVTPAPIAEPGPWSGERIRVASQIAALKAKLKDLDISLQANQLALDRYSLAKRAVYDKQEEFTEAINAVGQARHRYQQVQSTLANIVPAITAVEQNRLLQFSEGQPARGSAIPVSPSAGTVVLLALLAGTGSGVIVVVLAEILDNVFRSSAQVAKSLGLPMLESIDEIVTGRDRRSLFLRRAVLSPLVIVCFAGLAGLTGSMAYLSIQQPWTYQRIRRIPEAALDLFAERSSESRDESAGP
jgi:hypothetical protein